VAPPAGLLSVMPVPEQAAAASAAAASAATRTNPFGVKFATPRNRPVSQRALA